ncbi:hypothetical protein N7468_008129 [Penicillium chermesinum]|uniref:Uncharacterized protein n=1 Tax=Penicillium chermesinum TaxID=63820 RepID=A0A9W9NP75_9EURO|nr:uncharacterized protein N7468_008129 [Penicillium chermesinum]KAJ5223587.1 hypothetical protein N7468_008129 [Penicillium chermesinum]
MPPESKLQSILLAKHWFGFDLDDTLHEFRKASSQASQAVFDAIHSSRPEIFSEDLQATYQGILRSATANAFIDGRTSTDYRRERFSQLLQAYDVNPESDPGVNGEISSLLDTYKSVLKSNLATKSGVIDLMQELRRLGKKIIIITEGPADAQEWTVKELGLQRYVDILVTTNEVGRSKLDGLLGVILQKYGICADDIVYFGDNPVRDIEPAQREGILAILYSEKQEKRLEDLRSLRIDSWETLRGIVTLV